MLEEKSPTIISVPAKEIKGKTLEEISFITSKKIENLRNELDNFKKTKWEEDFVQNIKDRIETTKLEWEDDWNKKSKGKELLLSILKKYCLSSHKGFVKDLIRANKESDSEEWKILKDKISPITNI